MLQKVHSTVTGTGFLERPSPTLFSFTQKELETEERRMTLQSES